MKAGRPHLSVVVPLFNEEEALRPLVEAVASALGEGEDWELLLVDDGSTDSTQAIGAELARSDGRLRFLQLARNYGQTPAMQAGFDHACGAVVVSMDGDLQNDPRDIPVLTAKLEEGYDLVVGYRQRRQDKLLTRKVPSWVANRIIRRMTGLAIRDNGCSLKAYRRELLERMCLYSDLHRFIPAVAAGMAGARIAEVPVRHHARQYGRSKYGLSRVLKVLGDLMVVRMIRYFGERPLGMFAAAASTAFLLGISFAAAAATSFFLFSPEKAHALVLPGAAVLWLGLSGYLLMLGLLGEALLRKRRERRQGPGPLNHEEVW